LLDEAERRDDPVLSIVAERQYVDWRGYRRKPVDALDFGQEIEAFCGKIVKKLRAPGLTPDERRQLEAEAKRRAEEEERVRQEAKAKQQAEERERLREEAQAKQRAEEEAPEREQAEAERRAEGEERFRQQVEAKRQAEEQERLQKDACLMTFRADAENGGGPASGFGGDKKSAASEPRRKRPQCLSGTRGRVTFQRLEGYGSFGRCSAVYSALSGAITRRIIAWSARRRSKARVAKAA
jgi:hypothetical protein